ncbi:MAG: HAMP domain-containing histidine kinase [Clostridia bacterium]|nr:HAMP domain-containing histidine kinase [Clostridia bacterium]
MDASKTANMISSFAWNYISEDNMSVAENFDEFLGTLMLDEKYRVMIINKDSLAIFDSHGNDAIIGKAQIKQSVITALGGEEGNDTYEDELTGYDVIDVSVPIKAPQGIVGAVNATVTSDKIGIFVGAVKDELILLSVLSCLLIGLVIFVVANLMTRRIIKFTEKITLMSDGILDEKMDIRGNDEIARMGVAFNTMAEKLAGIEQQRIQFVSDASHELKTPLSSIKLMSDSIIQNPDIPKEQIHEFLSDINNEVDRLNRIINKLLSITKMDTETEKVENNFELLDLREVVSDIIKTLYPLAKNSEIALNFTADKEIYILGDKDTLFQAIYNICDNAIKYTKRYGEVNVILDKKDLEAHIVVRDNGVGMRTEDTEHIFERFYRVDKARARETGGTGLGLAIANAAVKAHKGSIQVFSEPNIGSEFTIILPLAEKNA